LSSTFIFSKEMGRARAVTRRTGIIHLDLDKRDWRDREQE